LLPALPIEIGRQQMTGLILKHGIDAHDEGTVLTIPARKMPANHFIGDRKKSPVWTIGALDSRFLTHSANPLIGTSRCITSLAGLAAFKSKRVNVCSPAKQGSKKFDLGVGRRIVCNRFVVLIRTAGGICSSAFRNGSFNAHTASVAEGANGSRSRSGCWFKRACAAVGPPLSRIYAAQRPR
jgi:hypothetical protein